MSGTKYTANKCKYFTLACTNAREGKENLVPNVHDSVKFYTVPLFHCQLKRLTGAQTQAMAVCSRVPFANTNFVNRDVINTEPQLAGQGLYLPVESSYSSLSVFCM